MKRRQNRTIIIVCILFLYVGALFSPVFGLGIEKKGIGSMNSKVSSNVESSIQKNVFDIEKISHYNGNTGFSDDFVRFPDENIRKNEQSTSNLLDLSINHHQKPIRDSRIIDDKQWHIVVPDDYPTIQGALDKADRKNWSIYVRSGVYAENIVINKPFITLQGEDKNNTIIDGSGEGDVVSILKDSDGINISGFSISMGGVGCSGIKVLSHYNVFCDIIIRDNHIGMYLYHSTGNLIELNEIIDNDYDGVLLYHSIGNDICNNLISDNQKNGITCSSYSVGSVINANVITGSSKSGIMISESSTGNMIVGNSLENNHHGVHVLGIAVGNLIYHNYFIGNSVNAFDTCTNLWDNRSIGNYWDDYNGVDSDGDGIGDTPYNIPGGNNKDSFPLMSPFLDLGINRKIDSDVIEPKEKIITDCIDLSTSSCVEWKFIVPDDYPTIQEAVDNSLPGDSIFVKAGRYDENILIDVDSLFLQGEDPYLTCINGQGVSNTLYVLGDDVHIAGFTIANDLNGYSGVFALGSGVIIQDNIINDCTYGVTLKECNNNFIFDNCIKNNSCSGINVCNSTENLISGNFIYKNGDGIMLTLESSADIVENKILMNNYYGILLLGCSGRVIKGNLIESNGFDMDGWFGIQMFHSNCNIISDNVIVNNSNDGISLRNSILNIFVNNTINKNSKNGASFWFYSSNNTLKNNTFLLNGHSGVLFSFSNNNIIETNSISTFLDDTNGLDGIDFYYSNGNSIFNNTISAEYNSILLLFSDNNVVSNNTLRSRCCGDIAGFPAITLDYSCNNIIKFNIISESNDCIALIDYSCNNIISLNRLTNNKRWGIYLDYCLNNTVENNILIDNKVGIYFDSNCMMNFISHNTFVNNGIWMQTYVSGNVFEDNTINGYPLIYLENISNYQVTNRSGEIILVDCDNISIKNQVLMNSTVGIILWNTTNSCIESCTIGHQSMCSICLYGFSNGNSIYRNNILKGDKYRCIFMSNSFRNSWDENYWDTWGSPFIKIIVGSLTVIPPRFPIRINVIPYVNVDWYPARETWI